MSFSKPGSAFEQIDNPTTNGRYAGVEKNRNVITEWNN